MPPTIAVAAFVFGLLFLVIAFVGSSVKVKELTVPELSMFKRALLGAFGAALVLIGLNDGRVPVLSGVAAPIASAPASAPGSVASANSGPPLPCFADVPAGNVHTIMTAMDRRTDKKFQYGKPRDDVVAFQWSDGKTVLGGVKMRTLASGVGFDIVSVVDSACNLVQIYRNLDRGDVPKDKPIAYDTLRYDVGGNAFNMDVSYQEAQLLSVRTRQVTP